MQRSTASPSNCRWDDDDNGAAHQALKRKAATRAPDSARDGSGLTPQRVLPDPAKVDGPTKRALSRGHGRSARRHKTSPLTGTAHTHTHTQREIERGGGGDGGGGEGGASRGRGEEARGKRLGQRSGKNCGV